MTLVSCEAESCFDLYQQSLHGAGILLPEVGCRPEVGQCMHYNGVVDVDEECPLLLP